MFSHIMVGADDIEASRVFYDAVLGTLGCKPGILSVNPTGHTRYLYIHENNMDIRIHNKMNYNIHKMG